MVTLKTEQSKRKQAFFWINAMAPLTSVILGSILVYMTHAEKHGVQVVSEHPSLPDQRVNLPVTFLDQGSNMLCLISAISFVYADWALEERVESTICVWTGFRVTISDDSH